ncbi:MAG: ATP-binding protein [Nanoarchaeota archaeon]
MNKQELLELIKTGEGLMLEFKEGFNLPSLGKEICAFANSRGGKIILGVNDSGNIKGFSVNNSQISQIQQIARSMDPVFEVSIEKVDNLVVINILEGKNKPYSINGKFYLRVGANSQQLKRDELREFFKEEGLISFDEKANKKFDLEKDFDEKKFKHFLKLARITDNQNKISILKNLGLIEKDKLINAGVLLFCDRISKFFLQGKVTCVLFEGTSSNIIDKKEFDSDFISNYEDAYNFIASKLNTKFIIDRYREEKLELPRNAIREALMNAFVHRDYFSNGHVQVNIFIDRVEISSPGGLMKALKKEDFGNKSMPRNQLLFDLMARTDYVEKAGTGIKRIKNAMKKYGLKVEFKSTGFFTSILHREKINEPAKNQPKTSQKPAKEERKKLILEAIKGRRFTKRTFADELRINKSTVESDLEELKKERIIEFVGSKKGGYWKILK